MYCKRADGERRGAGHPPPHDRSILSLPTAVTSLPSSLRQRVTMVTRIRCSLLLLVSILTTLTASSTTTPQSNPTQCHTQKHFDQPIGDINRELLLPFLDVSADQTLSRLELQSIVDRFTNSHFNRLKKSEMKRFIKQCANITTVEEEENDNDDHVDDNDDNVDDNDADCQFNSNFLLRVLHNTCAASSCGIQRTDEQQRLLSAIVDDLYNAKYCLHDIVLEKKHNNNGNSDSFTFERLLERGETVLKWWIWAIFLPVLIRSYYYNRFGRRGLNLRKIRLKSCASIRHLTCDVIKATWYYQNPTFKKHYVLYCMSLLGGLLFFVVAFGGFGSVHNLLWLLPTLFMNKYDVMELKMTFSYMKEESLLWQLSWYSVVGLVSFVLVGLVSMSCYIVVTFVWMDTVPTGLDERIRMHNKSRRLAIYRWTKDSRVTSVNGRGIESGSQIEDVCFNVQNDVEQNNVQVGYHDLAGCQPWDNYDTTGSTNTTPANNTNGNRFNTELQTSVPTKEQPMPPRPMKTPSSKPSTRKKLKRLQNEGDGEAAPHRRRLANNVDWMIPGAKCYAKSNWLSWSNDVRQFNGSEAKQTFTMIKHKIHTFSWKTGICWSRDDESGTRTEVNGNELSRLCHEIAVNVFGKKVGVKVSKGRQTTTMRRQFQRMEIHANQLKGKQVSSSGWVIFFICVSYLLTVFLIINYTQMLEGFAEAGRAYRIRGSDYYDHHEDDMSDDELNDDEESDVTYQTPDKVIQQTKRKYRHSHGIGSCYNRNNVRHVVDSDRDGGDTDATNIIVTYYMNNSSKEQLDPNKSHIKFTTRKQNSKESIILDIEIWEHVEWREEGRGGGKEKKEEEERGGGKEEREQKEEKDEERNNVSSDNQMLSLPLQKDLTRHIALTCWKTLFPQITSQMSDNGSGAIEQATLLDAFIKVGSDMYFQDCNQQLSKTKTLEDQYQVLLIESKKSFKGQKKLTHQSLTQQYRSALHLYYNLGRRRWIETKPVTTTTRKSPTTGFVFSQIEESPRLRRHHRLLDSNPTGGDGWTTRTPCCWGHTSDLINGDKIQVKLVGGDKYYHEGQISGVKKSGNPTYTVLFEDGKDLQNVGQNQIRQPPPIVHSSPYCRYFYGEILKVKQVPPTLTPGTPAPTISTPITPRPGTPTLGTPKPGASECYCLVRFNDGILSGNIAFWVHANSVQKFKQHHCHFRSIQYRRFFNSKKCDQEHRHWCYGSPPPYELGGPRKSTYIEKLESGGTKSGLRKSWLSMKGKVWYGGCTQCGHCKEYFCRGHIQSHRMESDKGCNHPNTM